MHDKKTLPISRRTFLVGAAAAGTLSTVGTQGSVLAATRESKLRLGVVGCGGRGKWIANLFQEHGGYSIVAAADYFEDRVGEFGERFGVADDHRFTGLDGYKSLLDCEIDAVAIISPPYCHPEQGSAGVDAGKHVYLAKPVAVDVPGCHSVRDAAQRATESERVFLIDFQTRANALYQEAVRRVHAGEIGTIVNGESMYHAGPTWNTADHLREAPEDTDHRIRAWGLDRRLSGDIITEQNIHTLDVATWILDAHPESAYGHGGRFARDIGSTWDAYSVIYRFPNDVLISFSSKQHGDGQSDITCRMYGTQGTIDTDYFGEVQIRGQRFYKGGSTGNLYTDGAVSNIGAFYDHVLAKNYSNDTVAPSVRSNLTTILGRTAAELGRDVSWDEMLRRNERVDPNLGDATR